MLKIMYVYIYLLVVFQTNRETVSKKYNFEQGHLWFRKYAEGQFH